MIRQCLARPGGEPVGVSWKPGLSLVLGVRQSSPARDADVSLPSGGNHDVDRWNPDESLVSGVVLLSFPWSQAIRRSLGVVMCAMIRSHPAVAYRESDASSYCSRVVAIPLFNPQDENLGSRAVVAAM